MNPPITVYVAGPIQSGDQFANCGRAIRFGQELHLRGFVAYVPHWGAIQQLHFPWTHEEWLEYDFVWLDKCECLFRLAGASSGSDREVARARERNMSVFHEDHNGLHLLEQYRRVKMKVA
jgi:hypothetical protein